MDRERLATPGAVVGAAVPVTRTCSSGSVALGGSAGRSEPAMPIGVGA